MTTMLFVSNGRHPGGAEKSLAELVCELHRWHEYSAHLAAPNGFLTSQLAEHAASFLSMPTERPQPATTLKDQIKLLLSSIDAMRRILRTCLANKPAAIYANSLRGALCAMLAACKTHTPLLYHNRDTITNHRLAATVIPKCRHVISPSHFADQQVAWYAPPERRFVVHNGVKTASFSGELKPFTGTIGYAGQFLPSKRIELILKAMPAILAAFPYARLILAGNDLDGDHPEYEAKLRAIVQSLGIEDQVEFHDWYSDIREFLAKIDVLVAPATREPFGRIAVEAMASAIPVVAARDGAFPELIDHGKTGLLCPPVAQHFASSIARLFSDDAFRIHIGNAALAESRRCFDISSTVSSTHNIIQATIESAE